MSEELRKALHHKNTYNRTWIVERHGYRTPAQVRADQRPRRGRLMQARCLMTVDRYNPKSLLASRLCGDR